MMSNYPRPSSVKIAYLLAALFLRDGTAFVPLFGRHGNSNKIIATRNHFMTLLTPWPRSLKISSLSSSSSSSSLYGQSTSTSSKAESKQTSKKKGGGFIDTELRGAAMKLHTRKQSPKEGEASEKRTTNEAEGYVTTHADYLAFLTNSQWVYQALEDAVNSSDATPALHAFRTTGLERVGSLETDIKFMMNDYNLERPTVGKIAVEYANVIQSAASENRIPEFMCHYYNFYFAHTAGGRMIGKKMSALLLNKKTLEFYKWDGDLNQIKEEVKDNFEKTAATWSEDEKSQCVNATAAAFKGGGGINRYLSGEISPH